VELARRAAVDAFSVRADELERWLVAERLAVQVDGRLVATRRGVELGELLSSSD
jgi:hypothetical protein